MPDIPMQDRLALTILAMRNLVRELRRGVISKEKAAYALEGLIAQLEEVAKL